MTYSDTHRLVVLRALVSGERSLSELRHMLKGIPWDSEERLVMIYRAGIRRMVARAVAGELPHEQVQEWAELLEGRDDLGYEAEDEDLLRDAVFELANPLLTGLSLVELHSEWLGKLA